MSSFLTHTYRFALEDIDSSTRVVWITVMIHLHYMNSQRWVIFLKIFAYVYLKEENHILYIGDGMRASE